MHSKRCLLISVLCQVKYRSGFLSVIRRDAYKELFETFEGCSVESFTIPLPFQKCNLTRWLVRGKVIFNILTNWEILKMYFTLIEGEGEANVRYKPRLLKEMLQDPINYLYFHFLPPWYQSSRESMLIFRQPISKLAKQSEN